MKRVRWCGVFIVGLIWTAWPVIAQTWVLDPQAGWQDVADLPQGEYLTAISQIKQQLASGKSGDGVAALEQLKADFPELAGGDLEVFIEAEKIYAKRNLGKAGKLYKEFLDTWPDSPLQPAAMERYFSIGTAFLQGQKRTFLWVLRLPAFDDGVNIMRNIADKAGNSPIALRALQVTAENQERRKRFIEAYHTWAEIAARWPTGAEGRDALLRMARALHASYDGPDYDESVLRGAQSYFEDYMQRYPQIAEELKLSETLRLITEQLAYKQYEVGRYYERIGNQDAAHRHYRQVIEQWPDTGVAQMAAERLGPDTEPPVKPTFRRKLFNAAGGFLDNWFGLKLLFGSSEAQSDGTNATLNIE